MRSQIFSRWKPQGGITLVIAAIVALVIANSPLAFLYNHILNEVHFGIDIPGMHLNKSVLHWVNDGLMVIFFFLVGLEIKRELIRGQLAGFEKALLPTVAAIGGMAVPALIFWLINKETPATLSGWAIPSATDIAFALGVLALLGSRAPVSLKVLLTAIAVIDDLGAIIIIAIFYSHGLNILSLVVAGLALAALIILNRMNVGRISVYLFLLADIVAGGSGIGCARDDCRCSGGAVRSPACQETPRLFPVDGAGEAPSHGGCLCDPADLCVCQCRRFVSGVKSA
jgi:NhaA family Na+:H+ antiporter